MDVRKSPDIIETDEALLENLLSKEAELDRELFRLRDDKVQERCELWFHLNSRKNESVDVSNDN